MTTDPFTLVLTAYLVTAAVTVGLRCYGKVSTPGKLLSWIGPIGMRWALLKFTAIPWVERQAIANRGEDYREYQRTTNAYFPCFYRGSQRMQKSVLRRFFLCQL